MSGKQFACLNCRNGETALELIDAQTCHSGHKRLIPMLMIFGSIWVAFR